MSIYSNSLDGVADRLSAAEEGGGEGGIRFSSSEVGVSAVSACPAKNRSEGGETSRRGQLRSVLCDELERMLRATPPARGVKLFPRDPDDCLGTYSHFVHFVPHMI